ncbi:MAG: DNA polymerase III subunit delta [Spirochaetota bacterium]
MTKLRPVYLLLGPESGGKAKRIQDIRALCKAANNGEEAELHRFYPFETEEGEILAALQNSSLFSSYRLVLLAEAENLKASQAAMIASYLQNPSDSATLIITSSQTRVHPTIMKQVPETEKEIFWELFENQKKDWLLAFFRARHLDISLEAVDVILSLVDNNTQDLRTVSQSLAEFLSVDDSAQAAGREETREVTVSDVEQFIYHSKQESVFTLFEQMAEGMLENSLEIFRALQLSGEADPVQLFGGLLWQFRRLHSYLSLLEEGDSEREAISRTTVLGKSAAIRGKHNQYIYKTAARNYTRSDVEQIITTLCDTDRLSRELGTALQPMTIELFIYSTICKRGSLNLEHKPRLETVIL